MNGIKYRSADEMKDSGIEWLGSIPNDWGLSKIKHVSKINQNSLNENESGEKIIRYIDIGSVQSDGTITEIQEHFFKYAPSRARRILKHKDTIVSTVRTYLKAISYISEFYEGCIGSTGFAVFSPNSNNIMSKYLYYTLRSDKYINQIMSKSTGVSYPAINASDIAELKLISPQLDQQRKIANFLDIKTAQFDSIIAKKEQLIAKLEEAKKSLISEVVTGKVKIVDGKLVPRQPEEMKDSGVEWLGMIPKEWRATSLRWYITCRSGDFLENTKFEKECSLENSIPVIGGNGILGYSNNYNFSGIGIVVGRVGALCGNVHLINGEYWITDNSLIIGNDPTISTYYLDLWLRMINLNRFSNSTAQPLITGEIIKRCTISFPDENEQVKIVDFYKQISDSFYNVYNRLTNQLALLKSAKQSLISEAVTGKIDLRDWEIIEQGGAS